MSGKAGHHAGRRSQAEDPSREELIAALAEARAEQAATSDVLAAISDSRVDLETILVRLIVAANELCGASRGVIWLMQGGQLVLGAQVGYPPEWVTHVLANPVSPRADSDTVSGRVAVTGEVINVADLPDDPRFSGYAAHRIGDYRGCLAAPLVSDGAVAGVIVLTRPEPGLFTGRQVDLIRRFSHQAVVAVENARLLSATREALERQTATTEILRVISESPTDARPVFDRIVETAKHVLRCETVVVLLCDGDTFYAASIMTSQGLVADLSRRRLPIDVNANFPSRVIVGKTLVNYPDWSVIDLPDHERKVQAELGVRSSLFLPLIRDDECIGVLALVSGLANNFGPGEIAQAEAFRDQALIAIENARLFNETQEALEQQQASASILSVISNSVADTKPVFEKILQSCRYLFGGDEIDVLLVDEDGQLTIGAYLGDYHDVVAPTFPAPVERTPAGRAIRERKAVHWPNLVHGEDVPGVLRKMAKLAGYRSMVFAPMLKGERGIGAIGVARSTGPFQPREVAMLQSFADQAVIAIENARLFNETKEALEHQTASAEVLQVISRSVSDAAPVFDTIMEACRRLFGLEAVAVYLVEGDMVRGVAHLGWSYGDWGRDAMPLSGSSTGLAIEQRRTVHFADLGEKPDLPERFRAPIREAGGLTIVYAPMLWEDHGVGSLVLSRRPARPFSEKELKLVQSFADQAAIAIQNARLFDEVRDKTRDLEESLAQQTATADVLKVISRSAFDLDRAASTILEAAARLCRATMATLHLRDGDVCRLATQIGMPEDFERLAREAPLPVKYPLHSRRTARAGEIAHFPDAWSDPDYLYTETAKLAGYRAIVVLPLMRDGELVGVFSLARPEPGPFSESRSSSPRPSPTRPPSPSRTRACSRRSGPRATI
jgi:GAF domain-containing protein